MQDLENQVIIETKEKNYEQYIDFTLGEEFYAFKIDYVKEVLIYSQATPIPLSSDIFRGIVNIRGAIIPIVDLNYRFYNRKTEITPDSRILITQIRDKSESVTIGVLVDRVDNVINIDEENIKASPDFGSNINEEFIQNIGKYNDKFIIILNIHEVLNISELSEQRGAAIDYSQDLSSAVQDLDFGTATASTIEETYMQETKSYITFYIAEEIYGISMQKIREIISLPEIRPLSNSLPFIIGVINLRGQVVPIIDMRLRNGFPALLNDSQPPVLIVTIQDKLVGLTVDRIIRVQNIEDKDITTTEKYSVKIDKNIIHGVCILEEQLSIILSVDKLLSYDEANNIDNNIKPKKNKKTKKSKKIETKISEEINEDINEETNDIKPDLNSESNSENNSEN